jgi:hypothetical protein
MAIISGVTISGGGVTISGGGAPATDPYFMYNSLLLPGNGTNTAQNNTFLDGSTNNFSITRNGNTTQGTFSPYGSNWSAYLNGSACTTAPANTALDVGLSGADFTIEAWVNPNNTQGIYGGAIVSKGIAGVIGNDVYSLQLNAVSGGDITVGSGRYVSFLTASGGSNVLQLLSPTQLPVNVWSHVAVTRSSGTNTLWINGISVASNSNSYSISAGGPTTIGCQWYSLGDTNRTLNGYVSNARIVKGTAVYTSAFTPSTTPLTAISGTGLLTCQSNRFIDNSTNAFAITLTGSPSIQRYSPFSPSTAYDTSTIGGSGYFDGTTDYLVAPNNAALNLSTADYTIESWIYYIPTGAFQYVAVYSVGVVSNTQYDYAFVLTNTGAVRMGMFNSTTQTLLISSAVCVSNAWNHIAVTRSGSSATVYVNGIGTTGAMATTDNVNAGATLKIGADNDGSVAVRGYISDFRIVKGTRVYTSNFTPPTAPLTAIANTSILLNYTNAGIIDNAMMNNLETVGNAQISTTQSKFGGGSMYFDGTGDWLFMPPNSNNDLGTGNFTIEMWIYPTAALNTFRMLMAKATNTDETYISLSAGGTGGQLDVYGGSIVFNLNNSISLNTWAHLAIVRVGNTWTAYVNGTSLGSNTSSLAFNLSGIYVTYIGRYGQNPAHEWNGYIDDLRITKGYARYTSNFTPPTTALPLN